MIECYRNCPTRWRAREPFGSLITLARPTCPALCDWRSGNLFSGITAALPWGANSSPACLRQRSLGALLGLNWSLACGLTSKVVQRREERRKAAAILDRKHRRQPALEHAQLYASMRAIRVPLRQCAASCDSRSQ